MVFFFRSIVIQLFLNVYLIYRIKKNARIGGLLKCVLSGIIGIETILFFIGLFGREYLLWEHYVLIQKISAYWVIFSLYSLVLYVFFVLLFWLNKKESVLFKIKHKTLIVYDIIIYVLFFVYVGFHFQTAKDNYLEPQIKKQAFDFTSGSGDTTKAQTSYRLLMVSDVHLGYLIDKTVLQKYVNIINAQKPDIIILNGDLIDYYLEPLQAQKMDEELKKLSATHGVYFIPGNHEYKIDEEADFKWIRETGIPVLRDSVVTIDDRIQLIGRDDRKNKDRRMAWKQLSAQTDSTKTHILISHQPGDIKEGVESRIPLILCGHTHNGQLFPTNLLLSFSQRNSYGLEKDGDSYTYTTSGLGLSGFPFRIGSRSEMVVFDIAVR